MICACTLLYMVITGRSQTRRDAATRSPGDVPNYLEERIARATGILSSSKDAPGEQGFLRLN